MSIQGGFLDKDYIKQHLPLAFTAHSLGIDLGHDGRALCPFHDDSTPSFYLWHGDDGTERWWCQTCGFGGDCYDLITRIEGLSFPDAVTRAQKLLESIPAGYTPPVTAPPSKRGPADWQGEVQEARLRAAQAEFSGRMAISTGLGDPLHDWEGCQRIDKFLRTQLGWGCDPFGSVVMPHWNAVGELTGCKVRDSTGRRVSLEGSKYDALYGAWLGLPHRDVLLTEGETDMAWASWQVYSNDLQLTVLSLPRGAGSPPTSDQIAFLKNARTVFLALDPDPAGIKASRAWVEALADVGKEARLCRLPLNKDLRSATPDLRLLTRQAAAPMPDPGYISASPGGYEVTQANGNTRSITNWTLDPIAALSGGDDGPGFQINIAAQGLAEPDVIRFSDLNTVAALRKWCGLRALQFGHGDKEAQAIQEHLNWKGCYCPEVFQTDRVGAHNPPDRYSFTGKALVYPGGSQGMLPWLYTPSRQKADLTGQVLLPSPGRVGWSWIEDFLALTHPSITHNLLAWVVAASRRPEVRDFPLLFIGGSSGTGKSTLAKLLLQLGSSRIEAPLGSITPYILMQTLSSTTSIPIFIDEWTRLSRKDTLEAFQGLIPTIYEGGSAHRGQSDLSSITYRLTAPVITAGEDTMTLDREMDRAVRVSLSKHYQNPHSLTSLERVPFHRIGAEIHAFVTSGLDLPPLVTGDPKTRPDYNTEILRGGWRTLLAMLEAAHDRGDDVPSLPAEPDSLTEAPSYDPVADQENIYVTALQEAVTLRDSSGLAVVWPDEAGRGTWVRFMPLTALVEKSLNIQLPGKSRAFEAHFANEYKIISDRATPPLSMMTVRAKLIVGLHLDAD